MVTAVKRVMVTPVGCPQCTLNVVSLATIQDLSKAQRICISSHSSKTGSRCVCSDEAGPTLGSTNPTDEQVRTRPCLSLVEMCQIFDPK